MFRGRKRSSPNTPQRQVSPIFRPVKSEWIRFFRHKVDIHGTNLPAVRAEAHTYHFFCEFYSIYSCLKSPLINSHFFLPALQATGNFPTVTRVLLSKIPPVDGRMTYVYDEYVVRNQTAYTLFSYRLYIYISYSPSHLH